MADLIVGQGSTVKTDAAPTFGSLAGLLLGTAGVISARDYVPWTTPTFNAGNFTGSASMTWTVEAGDVQTYSYMIIDKTMLLTIAINTSTVGGTADYALKVAIPASKTAAAYGEGLGLVYNGTAWLFGVTEINLGFVYFYYGLYQTQTKWSLVSNTAYVRGTFMFPIN